MGLSKGLWGSIKGKECLNQQCNSVQDNSPLFCSIHHLETLNYYVQSILPLVSDTLKTERILIANNLVKRRVKA